MKQTPIYLNISFLIPIPNSAYGSLTDSRSAAKKGKLMAQPHKQQKHPLPQRGL